MNNLLLNIFIFLVCAVFVIVYFRVISLSIFDSNYVCKMYRDIKIEENIDSREVLNFDGFDNETGTRDGKYIIPNYVHFLRFGIEQLSFIEAVCILSAFKNQKPDKIFIHTDVKAHGRYWDVLFKIEELKEILVFEKVELPTEIFGKEINPSWIKWHASDVTRIRILMKFGGIFLDNDAYIVRNLNDFRRYEMALGWMENAGLANQVIIAHKNARFLTKWLESFKKYDPTLWYDNAGIRPTKEILEKQPYLVHRERYLLANHHITRQIYLEQWNEWKSHYAFHLLYNHQYILNKNLSSIATYPVQFNEFNIGNYEATIKKMVYDVYPMPLEINNSVKK